MNAEQRYYILIASQFAVGKREESVGIIKRGLKTGSLTERGLAELFLHLSLLLGFPAMLEGLTILRSITGKSDVTRERPLANKFVEERGTRTFKQVYGHTSGRLLVNLASLHHLLPGLIVRDVYGRVIARPGLSLKEREMVNVAVLTIQKMDQQLYSHVRGALRLGVPSATLRSVIRLASRAGSIDAASALSTLSNLSASKG